MRRARKILPLLALALVAADITVSGAWIAGRSLKRIVLAAEHARESPFEQRSRRLGPPYTDAIEQIRDAIAPDEVYLLVDGGTLTGAETWTRFDLAPRRAIFLGRLADLPSGRQLRKSFPRDAHKVVVAGRIPRLIDRFQLLQELAARDR